MSFGFEKDLVKGTMEEKDDKSMSLITRRFEALEKRVKTLEKKHQDLIDNLRIFMVNDEDEE